MEDQKIIELLKTNSTDKAFKKLYGYYPKVEKLLLSKGGTKDDAKDIYQEALIVLYKKAKESDFRLSSGIGTYLYSVCKFIWKDQLKKQNKLSFKFDTELSDDEEVNLQENLEQENKFKLAEKALMTLGEKCLNLLNLFYFEAKSMKEIMAKLNFKTENVAKNQKYKCLEKARQNLRTLKLNL